MAGLKALIALSVFLVLAGCASKFKTYDGPEVTRVAVYKAERRMYLFNNDKVLKAYDFGLGFAPIGDKKIEGDGKTPEGRYLIDRKNPNSEYYLSVGISYPNENDLTEAKALGKPAGGDIFIHGTPNPFRQKGDWTWGCISVQNKEIEDIYAMVKVGTVIDLYP